MGMDLLSELNPDVEQQHSSELWKASTDLPI